MARPGMDNCFTWRIINSLKPLAAAHCVIDNFFFRDFLSHLVPASKRLTPGFGLLAYSCQIPKSWMMRDLRRLKSEFITLAGEISTGTKWVASVSQESVTCLLCALTRCAKLCARFLWLSCVNYCRFSHKAVSVLLQFSLSGLSAWALCYQFFLFYFFFCSRQSEVKAQACMRKKSL